MLRTGRMPLENPEDEARPGEPKYTEAEMAAIVEYAGTFLEGPPVPDVGLTGADLAHGGELFRLHCASCHQMAGQGGVLVAGTDVPPLGSSHPVEVAEAVRFGPNDMPPFPEGVLHEDELRDVVAYVREIDAPEDRGGWSLGHWGPVPEGAVALVFGLAPVALFTRWLGERNPPVAQEDELR